MRLLILADDLTGALDSGVQPAQAGLKTLITYEASYDILQKHPDVQVFVIDAETRHMSPEGAYQKTYELAAQARCQGFEIIYKKSDSTLRGNIGGELAALLDAVNGKRLFFAPAYPRLNRTTVGGIQYVDGVPLARTVYAKDPLNPVTKSAVKEIIAEQTDIPVISTAKDGLSRAICRADNPAGREIVVIDAENDEDLRQIGRRLAGGKNLLLAGSSGFSATLPGFLGRAKVKQEEKMAPRRALVLCGSLNESSLEQVRRAADTGILLLTLSPDQLRKDDINSAAGEQFLRRLSRLYETENCVILQTGTKPASGGPDASLEIAGAVGQLAGQVIEKLALDMAVVFGGDTLLGVAGALKGSVIEPQKEILPGVVQSVLTWEGKTLGLVSKAGGFGGPDTLIQILRCYGMEKNRRTAKVPK